MSRPGPVCFRPDEETREWLAAEAERTGQSVSVIIAAAVGAAQDAAETSTCPCACSNCSGCLGCD